MKIVHICTSLKGGAGTAAFRIHEAMLAEGIDSNFLCCDEINNGKKVSKIEEVVNQYARNLISRIFQKIKRIFLEYFNQRTIFLKQYNNAQGFLECEYSSTPYSNFDVLNNLLVKSADIIHLHWIAGLLDYPSFFQNVKKPIVWTFHDMNPFQGIFHYKQDEQRNRFNFGKIDLLSYKIKAKSIKSCNTTIKIVCPSKWLYKTAKNAKVLNRLEVATIPYTIDFHVFQKISRKLVRNKFNIPETETVFLFACQSVGVFRKGFDLLIDALKTVIENNITVIVIGEESIFDISNLKVRFTGTITDNHLLSEYYSVADAFIIPSREDNLPNVVLESVSCGTPIIGLPVGGIQEHILEGVTGILAKDISSIALAKAITKFLRIKETFDPKKIRNYALNNFGNLKVINSYLNIYHSLIQSQIIKDRI
ncbi:hypothetical protein A5893_14435 [Pedobacter psychrophilus]|uniref:Glycosyl transferase family 1 domain-containing protein n=1 Tax=Pedobacter psychrophilus TaxID=1826909 RepID=A0A179DC46_9SPHI|nr:glycosyltransferase [Pedobacter psychrophilus]OAQ38607.1 hypothetical protein A5893_14435 [Pedobacter psychrophilus]